MTLTILIIIVLLQVIIVLQGIHAYRKVAGRLRGLVLLFIISASFLTLRTLLHSYRYLFGATAALHLWEHVAILIGALALAVATWKTHRIVNEGS